jgi:hypothetical protein
LEELFPGESQERVAFGAHTGSFILAVEFSKNVRIILENAGEQRMSSGKPMPANFSGFSEQGFGLLVFTLGSKNASRTVQQDNALRMILAETR